MIAYEYPDLLVAAVALVELVAQHRHLQLRVISLVLAADGEGAVFAGIVDDEDFALELLEHRTGNAVEHLAQGFLCVVRDDENQQTLPAGSECHAAFGLSRSSARVPSDGASGGAHVAQGHFVAVG